MMKKAKNEQRFWLATVLVSKLQYRAKEERVVSIDEMIGIQAPERSFPDRPMRPDSPSKREFEYLRHGTQTLIASIDVSSGKTLHKSIGKTRTELDFLAHLQQIIKANS